MSNGTFHRPADGPVTSWAGPRPGVGAFNNHYGVDIGAQFGWNVRAAYNGTVVRIYGDGRNDQRLIIKHSGFLTSYLHLSAITVRVGQRVRAGDIIAKVGTAGTGPHLHFEVHPGNVWQGIYTASIDRANDLIRGTRNDASSNPPKPAVAAAPASVTTASKPKPKPVTHPSSRLTHWPQRPLEVQDFPRGTYWLRHGNKGTVVPDAYRHALILALHGAGHRIPERSEQGAWAQIRRWLRGQHGYNTPTDRRSVGRDFQRYLNRQGLYRGAIDGVLGPQSIWAITTWLNRIRDAYNR